MAAIIIWLGSIWAGVDSARTRDAGEHSRLDWLLGRQIALKELDPRLRGYDGKGNAVVALVAASAAVSIAVALESIEPHHDEQP